MIPLTKIMQVPEDLNVLSGYPRFLLQPERYPDLLDGQHEARKWEYGMALEAIYQWNGVDNQRREDPLQILDAGGATSNFWQALTSYTSEDIRRVDPLLSKDGAELGQCLNLPEDLTRYARGDSFNHGQIDVITSISVIEHIHDHQESPDHPSPLQAFLKAAHSLLRPGGLLFLTTDYTAQTGPDQCHFRWMRERIYNLESLEALRSRIHHLGFQQFGSVDLTWHGPQVYDYSMASMAFTKI